jgi:hypothetical protein
VCRQRTVAEESSRCFGRKIRTGIKHSRVIYENEQKDFTRSIILFITQYITQCTRARVCTRPRLAVAFLPPDMDTFTKTCQFVSWVERSVSTSHDHRREIGNARCLPVSSKFTQTPRHTYALRLHSVDDANAFSALRVIRDLPRRRQSHFLGSITLLRERALEQLTNVWHP